MWAVQWVRSFFFAWYNLTCGIRDLQIGCEHKIQNGKTGNTDISRGQSSSCSFKKMLSPFPVKLLEGAKSPSQKCMACVL